MRYEGGGRNPRELVLLQLNSDTLSVVKWRRYGRHGGMPWRFFFLANRHREFGNGGPLWRVYMVEFGPSAVYRHPPLITLHTL